MIDGFSSATEMLAALRRRELSAVDLLDLHLERIERLNPRLNVIVWRSFDLAREAAQAADATRGRGEERALLGLPITIKDCIDVAGLPGTAGVIDFKDRRPPADAATVARLRAAGGGIMGKTNVPPWAGDWQADNPVYGRTNNPWNLDRTSGGSTGGAAAVAAGLTPLELGSDIGGSIRIPAAFCGVFGHKPSETAAPRTGHFPGTPLPIPTHVMGVQGPLARDAADLELALDTIAGPDVGEDVAWRVELPPARHERLADYRVAILPPIPWLPVDRAVEAALDGARWALERAGARVAVTQPEGFDDHREHFELFYHLLNFRMTVYRPADERAAEAARLRDSDDVFDRVWAEALVASAADLVSWLAARERYRAAYRAFFGEWDVLLAPISLGPAFRHDGRPFGARTLELSGATVKYNRQAVYPGVATLCGQPATAFPAGFSADGLPIGLQAVGPYLEDRTTIRFAGLLTRELGSAKRPPGFA